MKIVFLMRSLNFGGAEGQLALLSKGLMDQDHSVKVAIFYPGGPIQKVLAEAGVPVLSLDKGGRWDVLGFLLRLGRLLAREKPDVLHGWLGIPNILTVLMMPFFPRLRVVWGVGAAYMDLSRYDRFSRVAFRLECLLSRFPHLIISNSRAGLDYHAAYGFPQGKMVVIPNGVDTERFRPDPDAGRRVRSEWAVGEDQRLIGLVGRLDPMKDHPTFLRAAALLARDHEDVRFVCVGDGPAGYRAQLAALGNELGLAGRLIWAGSRADMPAVYSALTLATSSSYGEGLPNVVCEAMACGIPCVVTDVGDSALVVGDTGAVVPPKDPIALVEGWKGMLAKIDAGAPLPDARARILSQFGRDALVQRTSKALAALL